MLDPAELNISSVTNPLDISKTADVIYSDATFSQGLVLVFHGIGLGNHIKTFLKEQRKLIHTIVIIESQRENFDRIIQYRIDVNCFTLFVYIARCTF